MLPLLLRRLDQRRVLVLALLASAAEMALFAAAPTAGAAAVFAAVVIGALSRAAFRGLIMHMPPRKVT